ncbi:MAG: hypothetical protein KA436_11270 [Oligoflexales bacterium]|nr:hypothetical protein [Oligoflexales bacterium]
MKNKNIKSIICMIAIAFLLTSEFVTALTQELSVDDIIENHIRACGGRERLESLKTISRKGEIFFVDYGQPQPIGVITYRTDLAYPNQLRQELRSEKFLLNDGKNFDTYWEYDGANYVDITDEDKKNHLSDTARSANRELLWVKESYTGISQTDLKPAWAPNALCLIAKKNKEDFFHCFNKLTGILTAKGSDHEYRLTSNWREVKNMKIPFKLSHFVDGKMMYQIELEEVLIDEPIPHERFEKPALSLSNDDELF